MNNSLNSIRNSTKIKEVLYVVAIVAIVYFGFRGTMMLALGTSSPLTGVTGDSMTHPNDSWKDYYVEKGYEWSEFPFKGGLSPGDLVVVKDVDSIQEIKIGDVIIWRDGANKRIIHRVALIENNSGNLFIKTRSDKYQVLDREKISNNQIVGKAVFSIPYLGYPSTWF